VRTTRTTSYPIVDQVLCVDVLIYKPIY